MAAYPAIPGSSPKPDASSLQHKRETAFLNMFALKMGVMMIDAAIKEAEPGTPDEERLIAETLGAQFKPEHVAAYRTVVSRVFNETEPAA